MDKDLERMLRAFVVPAGESYQDPCWRPSVDVYRTASGWLVKCDLAGVRADDIELSVCGRQLTVGGVRRDFSVVEGCRAYSMEIAYNRFSRSIELPCDLDRVELATELRDGMLLVTITPRREKA